MRPMQNAALPSRYVTVKPVTIYKVIEIFRGSEIECGEYEQLGEAVREAALEAKQESIPFIENPDETGGTS